MRARQRGAGARPRSQPEEVVPGTQSGAGPGKKGADERGGGSILMAGLMGVVVTLSFAGMVIAGYLVAHHRARGAADLSALSAAVARQQGADACEQARRVARANGARVTGCHQIGDDVGFVVTVQVAVDTTAHLPGLPPSVAAEAHAGPVG